jgi:hypothetical protein
VTSIPAAASAQVILKAGYQQNFGELFRGQIYQMRVGKESNVDSYLDLFAADGDEAHGWATARQSLSAGYTAQDICWRSNNSARSNKSGAAWKSAAYRANNVRYLRLLAHHSLPCKLPTRCGQLSSQFLTLSAKSLISLVPTLGLEPRAC